VLESRSNKCVFSEFLKNIQLSIKCSELVNIGYTYRQANYITLPELASNIDIRAVGDKKFQA